MSDREYMRKLVDQVLGMDRNAVGREKDLMAKRLPYYDESVCKYFLCSFCPYEQFQATKSDIGTCPWKQHDEVIRDDFRALVSQSDPKAVQMKREYEVQFMRFLERLVWDLERKLKRGRDRAEVNPSRVAAGLESSTAANATSSNSSSTVVAPRDDLEERRILLELREKELLQEMEQLGEQGLIDEAQQLMDRIDLVKIDMERLRQEQIKAAESLNANLSLNRPTDQPALVVVEKTMDVCPTCGAFLIIGDAKERIEAHFEGKQHNGWARVRETLQELQNAKSIASNADSHSKLSLRDSSASRDFRNSVRDRSRDMSRPREYDRPWDRSRSREYARPRDRSRSREYARPHDYSRPIDHSRSRVEYNGHRDRDRHHSTESSDRQSRRNAASIDDEFGELRRKQHQEAEDLEEGELSS